MPKFRKKPLVEAHQWFKNGDHPEDACQIHALGDGGTRLSEGHVVRYFRRPGRSGDVVCEYCGKPMHEHGWIDTFGSGHIVCPADWIITGVKVGEYCPCKPDIFEGSYEPVDD